MKAACSALSGQLSSKLSKETIWRRLKAAKCRSMRQITDEIQPHHKADRIAWWLDARLWVKENPLHFEYTLFSDECMVYLNQNKINIWLFLGESRYDCLLQGKNVADRKQGIMLLGVISVLGRGFLVTVKGNLNSMGYRDLLADNLIPLLEEIGHGFKYQHDNAPIHTTELMREWFEQKSIAAIPWPATSPDLSIIENVWALLKRYVELVSPRTWLNLKKF